MHALAERRAVAVDHGDRQHLHADGVDDERISLVPADRIAHRSRYDLIGMLRVHADVTNLIVLLEEHDDLILELNHLEADLDRERVGRLIRPALIGRIGIDQSGFRNLADLHHDRGGFGLQDRVVVVADQRDRIAAEQGMRGVTIPAQLVGERRGTRWHMFMVEGVARPASREIGNGRVFRARRRNGGRREDCDRASEKRIRPARQKPPPVVSPISAQCLRLSKRRQSLGKRRLAGANCATASSAATRRPESRS